ncbi:MAG: neutral/alkaline non-lysosomal ceramidase N-terminal domain-containing protein [Saprospiraceae bacterium]|nr:neutral/alkaline non-lysosomal ceramidase N-terminal domain-containing protein [Saprospiraceae bacterium]
MNYHQLCLRLLLCALIGMANKASAQISVSKLRAGAASAHVNPPIGAFIAGDKQNRRFTGVLDSLFAKAVVLHDGQAALALVTVDCIGLLYPDIEQIRRRASQLVTNINLPPGHIVVSSTHTHSGPDVVGIWGVDYLHSGVDSAYMEQLIHTAAAQINLAAQRLQPVTARSAETQFGTEWVQNICDEEIDRSVTVLQFVGANGQNVASLTNFACHPTYLDAKYTEVSSDYVAGFYRKMAQQMGGENLFLQGAIGGWVQPVDGEGTPEKAYLRGEQLADAVFVALQRPTPLRGNALRIRTLPIQFQLDNAGWKQLAAMGTIKRALSDSVATELAWFAIGDAQFATHPGETAPFYGLETKKMMQTNGPKFVLGLGMDALGYILKPAYFDNASLPHAPYLTSMSVGKQTGPVMMAGLRRLLEGKE